MGTATSPPCLASTTATLRIGFADSICFHHPGYHTSNLLLTQIRVDGIIAADATPTYDVYHGTALLAYQIIVDNAFDNSRLALNRAGQQPVQVPPDGVLTDEHYYFIIDSSGT